jgi:hypothetical protein
VTPTEPFALPDAGPALGLRVRPGDLAEWRAGFAIVVVAPALVVCGALMAALERGDPRLGPGFAAAGWSGVALGASLGIAGLVLLLRNITTVAFSSVNLL